MYWSKTIVYVKKRIAGSLRFRSVDGVLRTIEGYEAMNMIRKGQVNSPAGPPEVGGAIAQSSTISTSMSFPYARRTTGP